MAHGNWRAVTKSNPCPICGGPDNCTITRDASAVWCGRVEEGSTKTNNGGQHLHILKDSPDRDHQNGFTHDEVPAVDYGPDTERFASHPQCDAKLNELASTLGVTAESLQRVGTGWNPNDGKGPCWTMPERDAGGKVIGVNRRYADGEKKSYGKRGLTYPNGVFSHDGPVIIVEGASDTAAGIDLECSTIGRPSASGGADKLCEILAPLPEDREIAIIVEQDQKSHEALKEKVRERHDPECTCCQNCWPGLYGAKSVAESIRGELSRPVKLVHLSDGSKDLRSFLNNGGTREALLRDIHSADDSAGSLDWGDAIPLHDGEIPVFPTHCLPGVLRQWVEAEAEATQTPACMSAMLSIVALSIPLLRKVEIEARKGWREPLAIFAVVALPPANRKSGVFADATKPVRVEERNCIENSRADYAKECSRRRQMEKRLAKLEDQAAKKGDDQLAIEAMELAAELEETPVPSLPKLIAQDATEQRLGELASQNGGRIASMNPEGGPFDTMQGKWNKRGGTDFEIFLKGHAADDYSAERMSRRDLFISRLGMSCGYAVQPDVISGLGESRELRGRGLLARFWWGVPQSKIGYRTIAPEPVADDVTDQYHRLVDHLFRITEDLNGDEPETLRLDEVASATLIAWEHEIELILREGGQLEGLADWGGKLAGFTLRIAAILHVCGDAFCGFHEHVSGDSLSRAIEIARWSIHHAELAFALMKPGSDIRNADAQYVLRWIDRKKHRGFTKREAYEHGRRRFKKVSDLEPALKVLVDHNIIREKNPKEGKRGRPSERYEVNPAVLPCETPEPRTQNTQYPAANSSEASFADIAYTKLGSEDANPGEVVI